MSICQWSINQAAVPTVQIPHMREVLASRSRMLTIHQGLLRDNWRTSCADRLAR